MSKTWLIEPRDPLIVRDGKPFSASIAGARATSLNFPFPPTMAGGARTRAGLGHLSGDARRFGEIVNDVLQIEIRGALLAEIENDADLKFLAPAPADCILLKSEDEAKNNLIPLVPLENEPDEVFSNLPTDSADLHLLGVKEKVKGKPHPDAPRFWSWEKFEQWLANPQPEKTEPKLLGHNGITNEQRTHVAIDYDKKSNLPGGLFQTRGLEFTFSERNSFHQDRKRLTLAIKTDSEGELPAEIIEKISEGFAPFGGERRIVAWCESAADFPLLPEILSDEIKTHCRLILLTPAFFEKGLTPTWLCEPKHGVSCAVKAVAVNRYQVISGWDFVKRSPKPTRRLCPAGTVFFLELKGENIADWIRGIWMQNISDGEQNRRDGLGLAALGVWDGKFEKYQGENE